MSVGPGGKMDHSGKSERFLQLRASGKRDSHKGAGLVYMLTQIAKVLELTEIERRLGALEERTLPRIK